MSKPNVFIIETLRFDDEKKDRYEGKVLAKILRLNGIESQYYYLRTKKEFSLVLKKFQNSGFRYLHISCHGNSSNLFTTLDTISFIELANMLKPIMHKKRLFLSSCSMVNEKLANKIIPSSKCLSIIGPSTPIAFSDAMIFWSSFYHLMFNKNDSAMQSDDIKDVLRNISRLFKVKTNYFARVNTGEINKVKYPL